MSPPACRALRRTPQRPSAFPSSVPNEMRQCVFSNGGKSRATRTPLAAHASRNAFTGRPMFTNMKFACESVGFMPRSVNHFIVNSRTASVALALGLDERRILVHRGRGRLHRQHVQRARAAIRCPSRSSCGSCRRGRRRSRCAARPCRTPSRTCARRRCADPRRPAECAWRDRDSSRSRSTPRRPGSSSPARCDSRAPGSRASRARRRRSRPGCSGCRRRSGPAPRAASAMRSRSTLKSLSSGTARTGIAHHVRVAGALFVGRNRADQRLGARREDVRGRCAESASSRSPARCSPAARRDAWPAPRRARPTRSSTGPAPRRSAPNAALIASSTVLPGPPGFSLLDRMMGGAVAAAPASAPRRRARASTRCCLRGRAPRSRNRPPRRRRRCQRR